LTIENIDAAEPKSPGSLAEGKHERETEVERPQGRRFRFLSVVLAGSFLVCCILQFVALTDAVHDNEFLEGLADSIVSPAAPPSVQTVAMLEYLRAQPISGERGYFLLPILGFLGSTPRQVAEHGGDCGGRARLLIALLSTRGIHASKWALYDRQMQPRHSVVEVDAEAGRMVVDPLFGLVFPRTAGGYYGVVDLRNNPGIVPHRIAELIARRERPGTARLDFYPLDSYIYDNARTLNWNKSAVMTVLHRILHSLMGNRVDYIRRPAWVERPALMVSYGAVIPEGLIAMLWVFVAYYPRRSAANLRLDNGCLRNGTTNTYRGPLQQKPTAFISTS